MVAKTLNYRRGRSGRPLERLKLHIYATETHCWRCGNEVDLELPYLDPITGKVNIWSKTIGHLEELDAGGNPYDAHLEHWHCNTQAGALYGASKRADNAVESTQEIKTSPDWD